MALLIVLLVLVLGYYYATHIPSEQIKLRQSAGWETYVYLGFHGLRLILNGVMMCLILAAPLYAALWVFDGIAGWFHFAPDLSGAMVRFAKYKLFDDIQVYHIAIALLALGDCKNRIKERNTEDWQQKIKHYDAMLRIVWQSMHTQVPIRISLKSRKVYVGVVSQEQFSNPESDYMLIIPFLSGYRDKDTLDIFFDCNYSSVYQKYGLKYGLFDDDDLNKQEILKLDDFRTAIRISEIESVSFFKIEVFDDFERYKKVEDTEKTE